MKVELANRRASERHVLRNVTPRQAQTFFPLYSAVAALSACGGDDADKANLSDSRQGQLGAGFPEDYVAPPSHFVPPSSTDLYAFSLSRPLEDPYWVAALRSGGIKDVLIAIPDFDNELTYSFANTAPEYAQDLSLVQSWSDPSDEARNAFRQIFSDLEKVIDLRFTEIPEHSTEASITISYVDFASNVAGTGFPPSAADPLGFDIFIADIYTSPQGDRNTNNFAYELAMHELGHALGLKHPFGVTMQSRATLPSFEDNSFMTVMTYSVDNKAYDGGFRPFDLMALAELYGVNPAYRSGDDVYRFSADTAVFVIDGGGVDTISAAGIQENVLIDLREGGWSFMKGKAGLISADGQLTISPGVQIENAEGGAGDDIIIGNDLPNRIFGGPGNDRIFAGEGADVVAGGSGANVIDLGEEKPSVDVVILDIPTNPVDGDLIFGFSQGDGGDVIMVSGKTFETFFPLISKVNVPSVDVSGAIFRFVDATMSELGQLAHVFSQTGIFSGLELSENASALLVFAETQDTGEDQHILLLDHDQNGFDVIHLATLRGNNLDIDILTAENFA